MVQILNIFSVEGSVIREGGSYQSISLDWRKTESEVLKLQLTRLLLVCVTRNIDRVAFAPQD